MGRSLLFGSPIIGRGLRQRSGRIVPHGLVRRRVLSRLAGTQPVRARERRTAREPRRRLAPRRSVEPRRAPLLAAAAPALLRLRRAPRPRLTAYNTRESHGARAGVDPEGG